MLLVIGGLDGAAAGGLVNGALHRVCHSVGVKNGSAVQVSSAASDGLNQRACGTQESFFIRIENCHQGNLGQIQSLAQEIDANQYIELAFAQIAQDLHPLQRLDL